MKMPRLTAILTAINAVLLIVLLTRVGSTGPPGVPSVLRAHTLELIDDHGQVRSRLAVEPEGEVVLRLFGENGTIRVKLGASEAGSGLLLTDEATEPAVHLVARAAATTARPATTGITVRKNGQEKAFKPE
jgi:hypothetical protein